MATTDPCAGGEASSSAMDIPMRSFASKHEDYKERLRNDYGETTSQANTELEENVANMFSVDIEDPGLNCRWTTPDEIKTMRQLLKDEVAMRQTGASYTRCKFKDWYFLPEPCRVWDNVEETLDAAEVYGRSEFSDTEDDDYDTEDEGCSPEDDEDKNKPVLKRDGGKFERHRWRRPEKIRVPLAYEAMQWKVYNHLMYTDVVSGKLSAPWLLSSICVVAKHPELVEKLFYSKNPSDYHLYGLMLCIDGKWTNIVINDEFPCHTDGTMACSQAKRKQLWVPLLEKALAKVYDCYERVHGGSMALGLKLLTGYSVETLYLENNQFGEGQGPWLERLQAALSEEGAVIVTNVEDSEPNTDEEYSYNLCASHAYEIKDLILDFVHGPLMRLRDVRGGKGWQGDWSDESNLWCNVDDSEWPAEKTKHSDDGLFWMSMENVMRLFPTVSVLRIRKDWFEYRVSMRLPLAMHDDIANIKKSSGKVSDVRPTHYPIIHIKEETTIDIQVDHSDYVKKSELNYQASTASGSEIIMIIVNDKREVITEVLDDASRNVMWTGKLTEGRYCVFCVAFSIWNDKHETDLCNVRIHSNKKVQVRLEHVPPTELRKAVLKMVVEYGALDEDRDENSPLCVYELSRFNSVKTLRWSGKIIAAVNRTERECYYVDFTPTFKKNAQSTRAAGSIAPSRDLIPPRSAQILQIITQDQYWAKLTSYHKTQITLFDERYKPSHEPPLDKSILHQVIPINSIYKNVLDI